MWSLLVAFLWSLLVPLVKHLSSFMPPEQVIAGKSVFSFGALLIGAFVIVRFRHIHSWGGIGKALAASTVTQIAAVAALATGKAVDVTPFVFMAPVFLYVLARPLKIEVASLNRTLAAGIFCALVIMALSRGSIGGISTVFAVCAGCSLALAGVMFQRLTTDAEKLLALLGASLVQLPIGITDLHFSSLSGWSIFWIAFLGIGVSAAPNLMLAKAIKSEGDLVGQTIFLTFEPVFGILWARLMGESVPFWSYVGAALLVACVARYNFINAEFKKAQVIPRAG